MSVTQAPAGDDSKSSDAVRIAANCLGVLWVTIFSLFWLVSMYLGPRRPTKPDPVLGMIYPVPYGRLTTYVTKFEYVLAGPPMWCAVAIVGIALVTTWVLIAISASTTPAQRT